MVIAVTRLFLRCFLVITLLGITINAQAKVTATIDKNPVVAGESFVLNITADEDLSNDAFNSTPLLKDFIVSQTSVGSQTSMINFKTSYSTHWQTVLIAKKAGNYLIPALNINGEKTAAIQLIVLPPNTTNNSQPRDIFIKSKISAKSMYVQQQFTLRVKLYFSSKLKQGSLTAPTLKGATITQIGKDKESVEILNGRRFRVIERNYAINPQQSGHFVLASPMFSGEIIKQSMGNASLFDFGQSQPVSVLGKAIPINVLPIPASYHGSWLPSELLSIHDNWQPKNKKYKVGDPITRTITLTAVGLSKDQLPKLTLPVQAGLKIYPDQAKLHTRVNNGKLISQKVQNFAVVASKPGTYILPKMVIPWWNTLTNRYQEAILPQQSITVEANDQYSATPVTSSSINNSIASINTPKPTTITVTRSPFLQWVFLTLWLLTTVAWFISSRLSKPKQMISNRNKKNKNKRSYYKILVDHCKKNQGEQVIANIIPWVNELPLTQQTITTIDEALEIVNNIDFTNAINTLQQCYYGLDKTMMWQGDSLLACIKTIERDQHQNQREQTFSLNP